MIMSHKYEDDALAVFVGDHHPVPSLSRCRFQRHGNLPRPKNVPPARFLNGLSIPVRAKKEDTLKGVFFFW